uniref:Thioredoxin domain-containing protein n=1 Tax=Prymnesium polylepis TaxID=72548 RepID=A0A6T7YMV1_9EUKA|mmetsp:Transcript_58961/g.161713  ORF Transcript_58961/g.161713 Transcript_58961/m.161713 type:complete len:139 (-) Transcript_58961:216-632(-)
MAAKITGEELAVPIETVEQWTTIAGEHAVKDMLFVVEVFAEWCGPSQAIWSTYVKLYNEYTDRKLKLHKVCAKLETEGGALDKFRTGSRPNFLFYLNGEQVAHVEGVQAPTFEKTIVDFLPDGMLEGAFDGAAEDEED